MLQFEFQSQDEIRVFLFREQVSTSAAGAINHAVLDAITVSLLPRSLQPLRLLPSNRETNPASFGVETQAVRRMAVSAVAKAGKYFGRVIFIRSWTPSL